MNFLLLPESYQIIIPDGVKDVGVLCKGWELLSVHNSRSANVFGFDHETTIKRNLPVASAITALDLPNEQSMLMAIKRVIITKHQTIH
jgi:hypothetical protein